MSKVTDIYLKTLVVQNAVLIALLVPIGSMAAGAYGAEERKQQGEVVKLGLNKVQEFQNIITKLEALDAAKKD